MPDFRTAETCSESEGCQLVKKNSFRFLIYQCDYNRRIRKGLFKLQPSEKKERLTEWLDTRLKLYSKRILSVDLKVAEKWGNLQGNAEKIGKPMSSVDCLLAAAANVHKLTIVTCNESNFDAGEVTIVNPCMLP